MKTKISLLIIILLLICSINIFATEAQIIFSGDTTTQVGKVNALTVRISTVGDAVGAITAIVTKSENVSELTITGKNGWQITYNKANGKLNAFKAEGTNSEEFMEIQYTINSGNNALINLSNVTASTIEYTSESLSDIVKNITVEAEKPTVTKELTGIAISNNPAKTIYTEGEKVDTKGLIVVAQYSDGTSKTITNYQYSPTADLKVTDKKVEISYTENNITKTTSYNITVNKKVEEPTVTKELTEIVISNNPTKTVYTEGENVDTKGLIVIAIYSDGTSKTITNYQYSPTADLKVTDKKVEISYTENNITKTTSYDITVNPKVEEPTVTKELTEIVINKNPDKTVYTEGEKVNTKGLTVIAQYSDGTSKEITNYTYTPTSKLKTSNKKVEIRYTEGDITKTAFYNIKVNKYINTNNTDDSKVPSKLPQTGAEIWITVLIISVLAASGVFAYYRYNRFRDI